MGGFIFVVLLCFNHLFAVTAPVYFVYVLKHYCWKGLVRGFGRLSVMGADCAVVVAVFAGAYRPFVYHGQIQEVAVCFPLAGDFVMMFTGLQNFLAFYNLLDRGRAFFLRKLGFSVQSPSASFTGRLVGDSSSFAELPRQ